MLRRAQQYSHIGSDISFEALSSYRGINVKRTRRPTRSDLRLARYLALELSLSLSLSDSGFRPFSFRPAHIRYIPAAQKSVIRKPIPAGIGRGVWLGLSQRDLPFARRLPARATRAFVRAIPDAEISDSPIPLGCCRGAAARVTRDFSYDRRQHRLSRVSLISRRSPPPPRVSGTGCPLMPMS